MKRSVLLPLLGLATLTMTAQPPHRARLHHSSIPFYEPRTETQKAILTPRFTDNWSITLNGGIVSPLTHHAFWANTCPAVGVALGKQVTPVFGFDIESLWTINTSESKTAFDASNLSLIGRVNLMNLFGGYLGDPRIFEIEAVAGAGWLHYYFANADDVNGWSTKAGLNFNFNLGLDNAWTIAIKPAIVWNMDGTDGINSRTNFGHSHYDINHANFELTAGFTYHFQCSNGSHHFTIVRPYDYSEVDGLNAKVNDMRRTLREKDEQLGHANRRIDALSQEVKTLRERKPVVQTTTITQTREKLESVITFRQGKSVVDASQLPNVERVATYLRNHPAARVVIKGYASPEGSAEINAKIAQSRAEAVEKILVNKYHIAADRITAEGQGVGDMFSEPDWNRVSICTIDDKSR